MLYKSKNILTLVTIGYIVGFIVCMYIEYSKWPYYSCDWIYWIILHCLRQDMQVLYLGRAPRTKEILPDFREKCRVTRHSRVFPRVDGQSTDPRDRGVTNLLKVFRRLLKFFFF